MVLGGIGLIAGLTRFAYGAHRGRWALLLVFPLIYFSVMATSYQIYGRYTLPLLPFVCLFAAIGLTLVTWTVMQLPFPRATGVVVGVGLLVGVLLVPVQTSVAFDRDLGRLSTVDRAYRWIRSNVEPGTKVAIETRALLLPAARYPSINLRALVEKPYSDYAAESFGYLVAATDGYETIFRTPPSPGEPFAAYRDLLSHATEVAAFAPSDTQPGPTLRIFKFK